MVEVVQDLLDHVTYAGGVGRRRADAVSGLGAGTPKPSGNDCAIVDEALDDPRGLQISPLEELGLNGIFDKPLHEKEYHLQLQEFSFRGGKLIEQIDKKICEVVRLVEHDVLWRSRGLPKLLKLVCDCLRQAQVLICQEFQEVWCIQFESFFYPPESDGSDELPGALPGGWLDLNDMFLTVHLLNKTVTEMILLAGDIIKAIPEEMAVSRDQIRAASPIHIVKELVQCWNDRVPWLGVSVDLLETQSKSSTGSGEVLRQRSRSPNAGDTSLSKPQAAEHQDPPFSQAINMLDEVLTVHIGNLLSDLHRTTYVTFVRVVAAYARWKGVFAKEREDKLKELEEARLQRKRELKGMAAAASTMSASLTSKRTGGVDDLEDSRFMKATGSDGAKKRGSVLKRESMSRGKSNTSKRDSQTSGSSADMPSPSRRKSVQVQSFVPTKKFGFGNMD